MLLFTGLPSDLQKIHRNEVVASDAGEGERCFPTFLGEPMELGPVQKRGRLPVGRLANIHRNVHHFALNAAASCCQAEEGR